MYIAGAYRTLLKLVVGAVWKRGGRAARMHFHWIFELDHNICISCAALASAFPLDCRTRTQLHAISTCAFVGAFLVDFYTGPNYMHHLHRRYWCSFSGLL